MPYTYVKLQSRLPVRHAVTSQPQAAANNASADAKPKAWLRIVPSVLISLGALLIANVAWPIVSYQLLVAPDIQKSELVSPVPKTQLGSVPAVMPGSMEQQQQLLTNPQTPQVLGADMDYTDPGNWFPTAGFAAGGEVDEYQISIPAVDIEDARVIIGGDDLDTSLIHYPNTALPGQLGSPVVFGHSILRQFYNPDINNPNRYNSIFSKIMTLETGDQMFVTYDGIKYTYEVKDKVEVQPEDLFILEQRYNNRELKLITCTPEGTYLRRGVVIAQLVNLHDSAGDEIAID